MWRNSRTVFFNLFRFKQLFCEIKNFKEQRRILGLIGTSLPNQCLLLGMMVWTQLMGIAIDFLPFPFIFLQLQNVWSETTKNSFIFELTYQLKIYYNNCISCNCCNWQNCSPFDLRLLGEFCRACEAAQPFCFWSPNFQECNPWKKKLIGRLWEIDLGNELLYFSTFKKLLSLRSCAIQIKGWGQLLQKDFFLYLFSTLSSKNTIKGALDALTSTIVYFW